MKKGEEVKHPTRIICEKCLCHYNQNIDHKCPKWMLELKKYRDNKIKNAKTKK